VLLSLAGTKHLTPDASSVGMTKQDACSFGMTLQLYAFILEKWGFEL
jgi:hypothetical protein